MKTLSTILLTATVAAAGVHAHPTEAAGVNQRQHQQRESIRNGIDDGSLTRPEAYRLGKSQARFERMEQRMRADGELNRRERGRLQATADANRGRIYRQRNDKQVRPGDS
ncbi:MAG: hypothetical protein V2J89_00815 [Halieaceae bacterium]|jgi:hypothetical protein|nr:hypothetical protein [Halieaceae bacterium]